MSGLSHLFPLNIDRYRKALSPIAMAPKGPFRLVTVNTAPERAKVLIGRMIDALKNDYDITHVDNCQSECGGSTPLGIETRD